MSIPKTNTELTYHQNLEVAIGQRVVELLNLKVGKELGQLKTTWGSKTVRGLGAVITRIVEEEEHRLKEFYETSELFAPVKTPTV
jgi:hypothetical protein